MSRRTWRQRRLGARREAGFSLAEVMVAMLVLAIIMGIFGPTMVTSLTNAKRVESQSRAVDQTRLAVQAINRELRSADCVSQPTIATGQTQSAASSALVFTTFVNNASPAFMVEYQLSADPNNSGKYRLERDEFQPFDASATTTTIAGPPATPSGWALVGKRYVADNLVKLGTTDDAFVQIATPRRSVIVTFHVQVDSSQTPRLISTTIAARNAWKDSQC